MAFLDGWRYCPRCAGALERHGADRVSCPACGFEQYGNSVPGAQALVRDDRGRLLLGRRANDPGRGLWDLPGGFLEEGEHPLDGLRREVLEETGLEFEPGRFLGVWMGDYDGRATLNPIWTGRIEGGDLNAADDVAELRWFAADALQYNWDGDRVIHARAALEPGLLVLVAEALDPPEADADAQNGQPLGRVHWRLPARRHLSRAPGWRQQGTPSLPPRLCAPGPQVTAVREAAVTGGSPPP